MAEASTKCKGIVIKSTQSGENDAMLTVLSNELGKISVSAKGIRSLHHKCRGSVTVLCYSNFVLKHIKENLYSLSQAELIEPFSNISKDMDLLCYSAYFCQLCQICVQPNLQADEEVRLLLNTLYVLSRYPKNALMIKTVFELKLAEMCGIMPEFNSLCPCGGKAEYFSVDDGETRCALHFSRDDIHIEPQVVLLGNKILSSDLKEAFFSQYTPEAVSSLAGICERFLEFHLGKLPKSLEFLHQNIKN